MTIAPGTRLGRYEIRSQVGAGGMGEVYLARDPKINRDVAISPPCCFLFRLRKIAPLRAGGAGHRETEPSEYSCCL